MKWRKEEEADDPVISRISDVLGSDRPDSSLEKHSGVILRQEKVKVSYRLVSRTYLREFN